MDRELAKKFVALVSEAHGLLHDATAVLPEAPKDTEVYEVKKRIAGVMVELYQGLLKPLYEHYPDLKGP